MKIKWKEDHSAKTQWFWWVIIGCVAGVLITLVVQGIYTSWAMFDKAPWWDVVTAFSTFGAVAVALWTLTKDARSRSEERRKSQGIYRWLFMAESVQAYLAIGELMEILERYTELKLESKSTPEDRLRALSIVEGLYVPNLDKHINALVYFKSKSAESLALLAAGLPRIRADVYTIFGDEKKEVNKGKLSIEVLDRIESLLQYMANLDWEVRPATS
ncbi:hypothetical protein [Alcaligenes endophyticus]|uniref:DUF4760 domain-containing protein n=1 Tax=Alcaligenes endophyticus TaxID=1929088 RepID=A0ABT8EIU1_9BURK|nr:hypothetical protein [Alcaligenes endophyticus]MCX5592488.1 hypothetical protein [Alcaligenes endophyticus]MDN4121213.1 hypothetical protein [Alcaligenes endophyticus]